MRAVGGFQYSNSGCYRFFLALSFEGNPPPSVVLNAPSDDAVVVQKNGARPGIEWPDRLLRVGVMRSQA
jgi:hypothetical protein